MKKIVVFLLALLVVFSGCTAAPATSTTTVSSPAVTTSPVVTPTAQPVTTTAPVITSTTPAATPAATPDQGTLEQRLELLSAQIEQQRQTLHIPGLALAVVKDDVVIFSQGFGVSDLETAAPVTPETAFAIGSSTKAFTSTLIAMLVEEGKINWSDPVSRYLPVFQMKPESDDPSAQITMVDVLSHRSGFPRMAILTAGAQVPLEEGLQDAADAEPLAPLGSTFYYSNEMYSSAALAAAAAAGSDWHTLVDSRILEPLGMSHTVTTYAASLADSALSKGYLWDEDIQDYTLKPLRNMDTIAPAGSIVSTIEDMALWLRFQLAEGELDGQRLVSAGDLAATREEHIAMAPGIYYGMGWMLSDWQGQPVVEHGGNTDGFSAEVAFLPQSQLGYVLLTNSSVNPLPTISQNLVWETLLGDWESLNQSGTQAAYQPYVGNYIANFANFKNQVFQVLVQNNRLAIDIPDQMIYELKEPDAEGKWFFALTDQISVSFDRDESGSVTGLKMYQSGITFELPREGVEIPIEIPLADLQKYLGSYNSDLLGTVTVLIQNNRLALDIPGQMVYELYPPDAEGRWFFRAVPDISIKFTAAADGSIESTTLLQSGYEFVMPRGQEQALPGVDEIMALRQADKREAALKSLGNLRLDASMNIVQSGVTGSVTTWLAAGGSYRIDEDYGKYGQAVNTVTADQAFIRSSFGPFTELHGKLLAQAQQNNPRHTWGDWRLYFDSIQVTGASTYNERPVYVLELQNPGLPLITAYVDAENGDLLRTQVNALQEGNISIPIINTFENYQDYQGIRLAFRETSYNDQSGYIIVEYQTPAGGVTLAPDFFTLTP